MKHTDNLAFHLSMLSKAYSLGLEITNGALALTEGHDAGTTSDNDFSIGMAEAVSALSILNTGIEVGPESMVRDTLIRLMKGVNEGV